MYILAPLMEVDSIPHLALPHPNLLVTRKGQIKNEIGKFARIIVRFQKTRSFPAKIEPPLTAMPLSASALPPLEVCPPCGDYDECVLAVW